MPSKTTKWRPDQRVAVTSWEAALEKLSHFLYETPGYPTLEGPDLLELFDVVESAFLEVRAVFETRKPTDR